MRAKGLGELPIRIYGIRLQAIEPPHRHWSQARWENLAHQRLVFRLDNHLLVELAVGIAEGV